METMDLSYRDRNRRCKSIIEHGDSPNSSVFNVENYGAHSNHKSDLDRARLAAWRELRERPKNGAGVYS